MGPLPWKGMGHILKSWDNDSGAHHKSEGLIFYINPAKMKYVYIYLQINGVNLEKVTHNEAVECFVTAKETVCLKVQKGAHAEIMVSAYTVDVLKFQALVSFQIGLPNHTQVNRMSRSRRVLAIGGKH